MARAGRMQVSSRSTAVSCPLQVGWRSTRTVALPVGTLKSAAFSAHPTWTSRSKEDYPWTMNGWVIRLKLRPPARGLGLRVGCIHPTAQKGLHIAVRWCLPWICSRFKPGSLCNPWTWIPIWHSAGNDLLNLVWDCDEGHFSLPSPFRRFLWRWDGRTPWCILCVGSKPSVFLSVFLVSSFSSCFFLRELFRDCAKAWACTCHRCGSCRDRWPHLTDLCFFKVRVLDDLPPFTLSDVQHQLCAMVLTAIKGDQDKT